MHPGLPNGSGAMGPHQAQLAAQQQQMAALLQQQFMQLGLPPPTPQQQLEFWQTTQAQQHQAQADQRQQQAAPSGTGGHGHQHHPQPHQHQHHVTFSAQAPHLHQPHHQVSLPPQHLEPQPQAKRQKTGPRAQATAAGDQGQAAEAHRGPSDAGAPRIGPSLEELNTTLIFEKVLTSSDTNNTGRIVVPKAQAVQHLPPLERQEGIDLHGCDTFGKPHTFRFRFWINNQSRMYLLEGTKPIQRLYQLGVGDVIQFAKMPDGKLVACGRRGTDADTQRRAPVRREKAPSASKPQGGTSRRRSQQTHANVRKTIRRGDQEYYFDPQKDGVFRALPDGFNYEARDQVLNESGVWSVVLQLAGEAYQAFYESEYAAKEALNAAIVMPFHLNMDSQPPAPPVASTGPPAAAGPASTPAADGVPPAVVHIGSQPSIANVSMQAAHAAAAPSPTPLPTAVAT